MADQEQKACSLADAVCEPCRGGVDPLKGEALAKLLDRLGGKWAVVDQHHLETRDRPRFPVRKTGPVPSFLVSMQMFNSSRHQRWVPSDS